MLAHCPACPSPIGDTQPRAVCEHRRRSACCSSALEIVFQPCELVAAKRAQAACLQIHDVHQAHKVDTFVVEATPTCTFGPFTVALQILLSIVDTDIVLARHIEDLLRLGTLQDLIECVELDMWLRSPV